MNCHSQQVVTCSKSTIETVEKNYKICSKVTIKTPERCQRLRFGVSIANLNIFQTFFLVLTVDFEQLLAR